MVACKVLKEREYQKFHNNNNNKNQYRNIRIAKSSALIRKDKNEFPYATLKFGPFRHYNTAFNYIITYYFFLQKLLSLLVCKTDDIHWENTFAVFLDILHFQNVG